MFLGFAGQYSIVRVSRILFTQSPGVGYLVGFKRSSSLKLATFVPNPKYISEVSPIFLAPLSLSPESHMGDRTIHSKGFEKESRQLPPPIPDHGGSVRIVQQMFCI